MVLSTLFQLSFKFVVGNVSIILMHLIMHIHILKCVYRHVNIRMERSQTWKTSCLMVLMCFTNDLDLAVDMSMAAVGEQKSSIIKKFADDTKWWAVVESAEDRACFQACLGSLQAWAETWQLQYNVDK